MLSLSKYEHFSFKAGSRTDKRATFLCLSNHMDVANAENTGAIFRQRKVAKRKDTLCRFFPVLLTFIRGLPKGISYPFGKARHPCHAPNGLFPTKVPLLGAAEGEEWQFVAWVRREAA